MSALPNLVIWLPTAMLVAFLMELWAALIHGGVWHRGLWRVHRTHHEPQQGRFEANDLLPMFHAPISAGLIVYGCEAAPGVLRELAFGVGIGMVFFGVAYAVVHDGMVHGRLPVGFLLRSAWLRRVRAAHLAHHAREHCAPYGFFLGPQELARARKRRVT